MTAIIRHQCDMWVAQVLTLRRSYSLETAKTYQPLIQGGREYVRGRVGAHSDYKMFTENPGYMLWVYDLIRPQRTQISHQGLCLFSDIKHTAYGVYVCLDESTFMVYILLMEDVHQAKLKRNLPSTGVGEQPRSSNY